jgi:hypothetical protein
MAQYTKKAHLAQKEKLVSLCASTVYVARSSHVNCLFSSAMAAMSDAAPYGTILPGAMKSTLAANDIFRIPIRKDDSKVVFYIIADSAIPAGYYPQFAIRLPTRASTLQEMSPAWGVSNSVGTSTQESGWNVIKSTAAILATTTGDAEAFIAGPFESAKYAMNFGATSTAGIDKNQNYFEVMFGYSTVASTGTFLKNTTNVMSTDGCYIILPIEIP